MNTFKTVVAAVSLGLACNGVAFASDATLGVKGALTPSACDLVLGLAGGVIDYGTIPPDSLSSTRYTELASHTVRIDVTCAGPTQIALQLKDNRAGTEDGEPGAGRDHYGLGHAPMGAKIGSYIAVMLSATVDGLPSHQITRSGDAGSWASSVGLLFRDDRWFSWSQELTPPLPRSVTTVSATMGLTTIIAGHNGMTFEDPIPLDGSAVMVLHYL